MASLFTENIFPHLGLEFSDNQTVITHIFSPHVFSLNSTGAAQSPGRGGGGCQRGSIPTVDPNQANHREALNHTHTQKQTLGARDIA